MIRALWHKIRRKKPEQPARPKVADALESIAQKSAMTAAEVMAGIERSRMDRATRAGFEHEVATAADEEARAAEDRARTTMEMLSFQPVIESVYVPGIGGALNDVGQWPETPAVDTLTCGARLRLRRRQTRTAEDGPLDADVLCRLRYDHAVRLVPHYWPFDEDVYEPGDAGEKSRLAEFGTTGEPPAG